MKVWEICKKENIGKRYKTVFENIGTCEFALNESLNLIANDGRDITYIGYISTILELDFAEVIDWTKIKKDTKFLVSDDGIEWNKRYFAYYKGKQVYCYGNGTTSWSYKELGYDIIPWNFFKLAEEE